MSKLRQGFVVSHTHWDRAWYMPFEAFRVRFVQLVDRVLDLLEGTPAFKAFTLDGQAVLVEDYLEIRPDEEPRIRSLVQAGRLVIGPWYTLPDQFLVSGEALIRNLQEGHRVSALFGATDHEGYIPDPFGHVTQMPQILQGFGIDTYLFMRGLSARQKAEVGSVFYWAAPSGHRVLAQYQPDGYYPAAALGHPSIYGRFEGHVLSEELAREQLEEAIEKMKALQEPPVFLLSNGFDHMPEQPGLPDLIQELNRTSDRVALEQGTVGDYFRALRAVLPEDLATEEGDLTGNVDHPILQSVYSARLYLKQHNHRAQRALSRHAEPVSAWLDTLQTGPDARPHLRHLWKILLRNHPHDDICGCSVDAVHEDNEVRYRRVVEAAEELLTVHVESLLLSRGFSPPGQTSERAADVWVFNPHAFDVRYMVEADILIPRDEDQERAHPARAMRACLATGETVPVEILSTTPDVMRNRYLEQTWGRSYRVRFPVEVPGVGYHLVHLFESRSAVHKPGVDLPSVRDDLLENEQYRVSVEDGKVNLLVKGEGRIIENLLQLEYQLDAGDTYSFGPVPAHGPWWATCTDVRLHRDRKNTLVVRHALDVPATFDRDEGPGEPISLDITTHIVLNTHAGVSITIAYENVAENGRLRAIFPFPATDSLQVDGHFRVAERPRPDKQTPEDYPDRYAAYPGELTYPTQHQGDFVLHRADETCTWLANRGLPEYELLSMEQGRSAVAVTLHRAVDMLSVEGGRLRRCQAGPSVPVPGAQCKRPIEAYLSFGTGKIGQAEAIQHARAFAHPPWVRELPYLPYLTSRGQHPRSDRLIEIANPAVELSTWAPAPQPQTRVLRLFNRRGAEQTTSVRFGVPVSSVCTAGLDEQWKPGAGREVIGGHLTVTLGPHEVRTLLVR